MINVFLFHQGIGDCIMFTHALDKYYTENNFAKDYKNIFLVRGQIEKDILLLKISENSNNIIFKINAKSRPGRYVSILKIFLKIKFNFPKVNNLFAPIFSGSYLNLILIKFLNPLNFFSQKEDLFKKYFNSDNLLPRIEYTELHYADYFKLLLEKSKLIKPNSELSKTGTNIKISKKSSSDPIIVAIGIGCTIRESNKIPSTEWFITLLDLLNESLNVRFIFYGGEAEIPMFNLFKNKFENKCDFLINLHPFELIQKLNQTDIIISGTTGPGHLASLSTTNQITLSEITNPYESGPYKVNNFNIRSGMKCSPCYRRELVNGCGKLSCLNLISNYQILNLITNLIHGETISNEKYNIPKVQNSNGPIF